MYWLISDKGYTKFQIQGLEKALTSLWGILDIKFEERQPFAHIKLFAVSNSPFLVLSPGILAIDKIEQVKKKDMITIANLPHKSIVNKLLGCCCC